MAPIVAEAPAQTAELVPALAAGVAFTVIVTEFVFEQLPETVSVKVYTVVTVGLTTGFEEVEVKPDGLLVQA